MYRKRERERDTDIIIQIVHIILYIVSTQCCIPYLCIERERERVCMKGHGP